MKTIVSFILSLFLFTSGITYAQDTLSLLFIGDIMGHDTQIKAAYDARNKSYDFDPVFAPLKEVIEQADVAIANLEVTLAGPPYKGYPQFSSPDAFALACKNNGVDVMVTANNHACDRGKNGIIRTLETLDAMDIPRTGTFKDSQDRDVHNLLLIEEKDMRIGLLNYTYGTNGIPTPSPTRINRMDTMQMRIDMEEARKDSLDKLIVFVHWGLEYKHHPNKKQKQMAEFLFEQGADYIIGSHPHVLQPMHYKAADSSHKEQFIAYSLGNFVSNQRTSGRDGGSMVKLELVKENGQTRIVQCGYQLIWVHRSKINGKYRFEILPCTQAEENNYRGLSEKDANKMKTFIQSSRTLLNTHNKQVPELDHHGNPLP